MATFFSTPSAPASGAIRSDSRAFLGEGSRHGQQTSSHLISTTSTSVSVGDKVFSFPTIPTLEQPAFFATWVVGRIIQIYYDGTRWMRGAISASSINNITVNVTEISGSGTFSMWQIKTVTGGSWVQSFETFGSITPVTAWDYYEDMGRTVSVSNFGIALAGVSRTWGGTLDAIGVVASVVNDRNASFGVNGPNKAWAAYVDAVKSHPNAGTTVGMELDITNLPGTSPLNGMNPYKDYVHGMIRGLAVAAGSDALAFGRSYAVDCAINITNNGGAFWTGLSFRHNSLMREGLADDTSFPTSTGYAQAIQMAHDHGISWYSRDPVTANTSTQDEVVRIWSTVDSPTVKWGMSFGDGGINFHERVSPGNSLFVIDYKPDAVNYLSVVPGITGQYVDLETRGGDTDIDLRLRPKGAGKVQISYAASAAVSPGTFNANRRIAIKDGTGTTVYIAASTVPW